MTEAERKVYLLTTASVPLSEAERTWLRDLLSSRKLSPYELRTLRKKFAVDFAKCGGLEIGGTGKEPWSVCPACGSQKVDLQIDVSRSDLLSREASRSQRGCVDGCLVLLAAPFTLGLSIVGYGAVSAAMDAGRALSSNDRKRAIEEEERRCAVMTCRICARHWLAEDWDDIHSRK